MKININYILRIIKHSIWERSFAKLNDRINPKENPFGYLIAWVCMIFLCIFFSIPTLVKYLFATDKYFEELIINSGDCVKKDTIK